MGGEPAAEINDRFGITLAVDQGCTTGIYIKCFNIAVIQPNAFAVKAGIL